MDDLTLSCLHACRELLLHQENLVFLLAETIGIQPEEVFYSWTSRKINQTGSIHNTNWKYFFHGLSCTIENINDRRVLPVSFGPGGRVDTCTSSSALQFIMTSKEPWRVFLDVRTYLAKHAPPYNKHSGSHQKMSTLWQSMQHAGLIAIVDPQLTSFVEHHTTHLPDGQSMLSFPDGIDERTVLDSDVHNRWIITKRGWRVLKEKID